MGESRQEADRVMSQAIIEFLILNIPILGTLKDKELMVIEKYLNFIELTPGEIVFQEGDRGDYVCFVVEGSLDVLKKSETGEEILISTLSKGRSIGEMSVIDDLPRSATIKARTKSTLLTLSRENFDYILRKTSSRLADYMLPLG
jgi:CRP-like cAMP-binding protein